LLAPVETLSFVRRRDQAIDPVTARHEQASYDVECDCGQEQTNQTVQAPIPMMSYRLE